MTAERPKLPEGWEWCELQDVAEVRLGRQRSPKNHQGENMVPYLRAANVTWDGLDLADVKEMNFTPDEVETYALRRGDILLSEASGSASEAGKPAIWQGELERCCFQNTLIRVRSRAPLAEYLLLVLRQAAVSGAFVANARGVGIHHLGSTRLAKWPIPVPPMAEQRWIAAEVARLRAETRDALADVIGARDDLAILERSLLDEAVAAAGAGAPTVLLGDMLDHMTSGSRDWKPYYDRGDSVFVLAQNVRPRRLDFSTVLHVDPPANDPARARSEIRRGDVLVTIVGAGTGTVAHVPDDLPRHYVCQSIALLRPDESRLLGRYLELFLSAPAWGRGELERLMYGQGRPHLGFAEMRAIRLALPSVDSQAKALELFDRQLAELEDLRAAIDHALQAGVEIEHSFLRQATTGEWSASGRLEASEDHHEAMSRSYA